MDGDPYAAMVALMREQGAESGEFISLSARMRLGRVVSIAPLAVRVAGKDMPSNALRVDGRLAQDWAKGDEVLLFTQDDQIFYISMKVARAI